MRKFAFALFILAPLVAEFLLGDFGLNALYALLFLAPMYGGGALVIREHARRTGRGWPTIVVLALAYGVAEEGLVTQSLFNPDYAGLRLLDDWYVPALGIGVPWTITVLAVHTIWSISVPIALVEQLAGPRRSTPWLRWPGLTVAWVLFGLGALLNCLGSYTNGHFLASWPKLLAAAVIAVLLVVVAFRLPKTTSQLPQKPETPGVVPSAWLVLALTLLGLGAAWLPDTVPTWVRVAAMAVVYGGGTVAVLRWSARAGWGDAHRLALAAAATLTYAWHSFFMRPFAGDGPVVTPVSHAVFALLAVALLCLELRSLRTKKPSETAEPAEVFADSRSR